jgi:hypothetical protein
MTKVRANPKCHAEFGSASGFLNRVYRNHFFMHIDGNAIRLQSFSVFGERIFHAPPQAGVFRHAF